MFEDISVEVVDRVGTISFNRPERMNAFSERLTTEFLQAMKRLEHDDDVRVLIVTGTGGKAFSAGYDLKESTKRKDAPLEEVRRKYISNHNFAMSPWRCAKPVIAMIDGYCLAGALELALCCDVRYCSDDSKIGVLESRFAGGIGTMLAPWILGHRCRELIYTGDVLSAEAAANVGLVDRVFKKEKLVEETVRIAKRMSRVAGNCQRWNKRAINQTFETMGLHTALQYGIEAASIMRAIGSPERTMFDTLRDEKGLGAALEWRNSIFEPFE